MDLSHVTPSLEALFTSTQAFGITTATPLQRAICRIIDGKPLLELAANDDVREAFTGAVIDAYERGERPSEIAILSAIRCAKSMICAAAAYRMARTCNIDSVTLNEPAPRVPVLSVYKDNAAATYGHLLGAIRANPWMRLTLYCEPTAETITVKHAKTGRPVEIKIVAGSRAGSTIVSRWLAGLIFDEAPRMAGQEHVVNLAHLRANAVGRMLPGAKILYPGSPWAPYGPVYDMVQEHRGKPSSVFICWAPGWLMNPYLWTPDKCDEMKANHPLAYRTDVEAKFASPAENIFSEDALAQCTRPSLDIPYDPRFTYVAAIDPATRVNAWTLVIAAKDGDTLRVVCCREWVPTDKPLDAEEVIRELADICRGYNVRWVRTDQYNADPNAAIGRRYNITIVQQSLPTEERVKRYLNLQVRLGMKRVDLPNDPVLLNDLKRVQREPTQQGGVRIKLPETPDGRHCDYAPALVLALDEWLKDAEPLPPTPEEHARKEAEKLRKRVIERATKGRKRAA